jgi:hypothetical protein
MGDEREKASGAPPLIIVSGGVGASGELVARTVLVQFPDADVPLIIVPHVRTFEQIEVAVEQAAASGGTIIHTLADGGLRHKLINLARDNQVVAIDLIGQLMARLGSVLGREPVGQPGLYRKLHEEYFHRVEAIEFTVAHDDGKNPHDLFKAEIVLVGVSRVGKTPLAVYLSTLGWKVANVPLIQGVPPPNELYVIDARRVVGLTIDPDHLIAHRQWRQRRMGVPQAFGYADPAEATEEMEAALEVFRHGGFPTVNITGKPIETSAEEVIALVTQRLKTPRSP